LGIAVGSKLGILVVDVEIRNFIFMFHNLLQVHHTFATAGSDGAFNFWDKDSKQRLKVDQFPWLFLLIFTCVGCS
jgi:hypothetical protein